MKNKKIIKINKNNKLISNKIKNKINNINNRYNKLISKKIKNKINSNINNRYNKIVLFYFKAHRHYKSKIIKPKIFIFKN